MVLFGSFLKREVERLSDVELAVEVASKESDFDRARVKSYERVEKLAAQGRRFRNLLEQEGCWYWEVFGFLNGRSRVIVLADYATEKTFVLNGSPPRALWRCGINVAGFESNTGTIGAEKEPCDCPF